MLNGDTHKQPQLRSPGVSQQLAEFHNAPALSITDGEWEKPTLRVFSGLGDCF